MIFKEFTVNTTDEAEELVADVFWNYSEYGVAVSSLKDVLELTENRRETYDYIDDKLFNGASGVSLVKGYFDLDTADEKKRAVEKDLDTLKKNSEGNLNVGTLELIERCVDGDDWIEVWRKHFRPISFGKITVCPKWINCNDDGFVVYLDSNSAFGTGEHETTSMCIEFLQKYVRTSDVVVDVGSGTGILGISAKKLGADKIILTDIDKVAVKASEHNVEINGVSDSAVVYNTDLLKGVKIQGDIVVANITADVLKILATQILSYVKPSGIIILSGILRDRKDEVIAVYETLGFNLLESKTTGEWSAVVMKL